MIELILEKIIKEQDLTKKDFNFLRENLSSQEHSCGSVSYTITQRVGKRIRIYYYPSNIQEQHNVIKVSKTDTGYSLIGEYEFIKKKMRTSAYIISSMYAKDFFYIYSESGHRLIANVTFYKDGSYSLGFKGAVPIERRENDFWVEGNFYNPTLEEVQKLKQLKNENKLLEFTNELPHDVNDYGGAYHSRNFPC